MLTPVPDDGERPLEALMIVCHCEAVNDRTITDTILSGASTVDDVAERCGAGSQCGGCHLRVEALLERIDASLPAAAVA